MQIRFKMESNLKAYKVLAACCIGNLASGFPVNSFGNVLPYVVSFLREMKDSEIRSSGVAFVPIMCTVILALTMFSGSLLEYMFGYTVSLIGVSSVFIVAQLLCYFTINTFTATVLTYCVLGYCEGVLLVTFLSTAMEWFPNRRGLAAGVSALGSGFSGFLFASVQSSYINPWNYTPDHAPYLKYPNEKYFSQHDLLKRVPISFLINAAISCVLLSVAITLVSRPTDKEKEALASPKRKLLETEAPLEYSVRQMGRSLLFWVLFVIFGLSRCDFIFMNSLSKVFGESFIKNDHFLAATGAITGILNGGGRLVWGAMSDCLGIQKTLIIQTFALAVFLFSFFMSRDSGEVMYFVWVCAIVFTASAGFSLLPAASSQFFGYKNSKMKIGLLYMSQGAGAILQGLLMLGWHVVYNWFGTINLFGFCALLAFLFSCLLYFVIKDVDKERIRVLSPYHNKLPHLN